MKTLFESMTRSAVISDCGRYRYQLTRTWDGDLVPACFLMLNPSTADANRDDPTIVRCVNFAKSWGCGGIVVVNLYAWRSTDPAVLKTVADPIGPENDGHTRKALEHCGPRVLAWGASSHAAARVSAVVEIVRRVGTKVHCLGLTKDGRPRHPLFVRSNQPLVDFPI